MYRIVENLCTLFFLKTLDISIDLWYNITTERERKIPNTRKVKKMKEQAVRHIEYLIWGTENMEQKSSSKAIVSNNQGRAQGAIELAHELGILTDDEYEDYWDKANTAAMNNPAYWETSASK